MSAIKHQGAGAAAGPVGLTVSSGPVQPSAGAAAVATLPPNLGRTVSFSQLQLSRGPSGAARASPPHSQVTGVTATMVPDWRSMISIEDRQNVRSKLHDVYRRNCPSYEELLSMVAAIDEEMIFYAASTRLDYFKQAIDFDNRLQIKRKQFSGELGVGTLERQLMRARSHEPGVSPHELHASSTHSTGHAALSPLEALHPISTSNTSASAAPSAHVSMTSLDNPLVTFATTVTAANSNNNNNVLSSTSSSSSSSSSLSAAPGTDATGHGTRQAKRRAAAAATSPLEPLTTTSSPASGDSPVSSDSGAPGAAKKGRTA